MKKIVKSTHDLMVLFISLSENLRFGLILPSRSKFVVFSNSPVKNIKFSQKLFQVSKILTCVHVCQINYVRHVVEIHQRQVAIETERLWFFQANRLNPFSRLRIKNIQVGL